MSVKKLRGFIAASAVYQILRDVVTNMIFIFLIFELCKPIVQGFANFTWESIVSIIMMLLFSCIVILQNYLNF